MTPLSHRATAHARRWRVLPALAVALSTAVAGLVTGTAAPVATAAPPAAPDAAPGPGGGAYIHVGSETEVYAFDTNGWVGGFENDFQQGDLLAAGDLDGDGTDEVAIAGDSTHRVYLFEHDGSGMITINPGVGGAPYGLATGDLDGDHDDEVFVVGPTGVAIFDATGSRVGGFGFAAFPGILLEAGDVDGDSRAEVILAGDVPNRVYVYEPDGSDYDILDLGAGGGPWALATGNVDGIDAEEIFVLRPTEVLVINGNGGRVNGFGLDAEPGYLFDAGDTDGDGTAEVVLAGDVPSRFYVYEPSGSDYVIVDTGNQLGPWALAVGGYGRRDVDGDTVPDAVELRGLVDAQGTVLLGPTSPCRETINVEIDYMLLPGQLSAPDPESQQLIKNVFDKAPRHGVALCPYPGAARHRGIEMNMMVDDGIAHQETIGTIQSVAAIKAAHFRSELNPYVHYSVWADEMVVPGFGEVGGFCCYGVNGKDFIMGAGYGIAPQTATFIHELGHALGLGHGGGDQVNYKPNYLSVMNYSFSLTGIRDFDTSKRSYDLSRWDLPDLNEAHLSEPAGAGSSGNERTKWYDLTGQSENGRAKGPADWTDTDANGNGVPDDDLNVAVDLNRDAVCVGEGPNEQQDTTPAGDDFASTPGIMAGPNFVCETTATGDDVQTAPVGSHLAQVLHGHDDWSVIHFGGSPGGGGIELDDELTVAEADQVLTEWDSSLTPERTLDFDVPPPGERASVDDAAALGNRIYLVRYSNDIDDPHHSARPGELIEVDRATFAVTRRVTVGFQPRSLAINPATRKIYVVNYGQASYSVSVVSADTMQVQRTVSVGQAPIDIAVNSHTNRVYVTVPYQERLAVINGATDQLMAPIQIGKGPNGLAVDETTNRIYVALNHHSGGTPVNALGVVTDNGTTVTVHPNVPIAEFQPNDVAVDTRNDRIYVANLGGGIYHPKVTVLRRSTLQVLGTTTLFAPGRSVTVDPDTHQVFVGTDGGVNVIDDARLEVTRRMPGAGFSLAVAVLPGDERELYVGNGDGRLLRLAYSSGFQL